jgi:hypothetical protein
LFAQRVEVVEHVGGAHDLLIPLQERIGFSAFSGIGDQHLQRHIERLKLVQFLVGPRCLVLVFQRDRNPFCVGGVVTRAIRAALLIEHPIEGVVLLVPSQQTKMFRNLGINIGAHEVVVRLDLEADRRTKAVMFRFHDRHECVSKVSRGDGFHRGRVPFLALRHRREPRQREIHHMFRELRG